MKMQILKILRNTDGYVSGQAVCEQLGVSRTAVWKAVKQLKEEGYEIESVPNKGYHISNYPDVITADEIGSRLRTEKTGKNIFYYDEADSTNNVAKKLAEQGECEGTLIVAETQTAGKGRRGKGWNSPRGTSIFMTWIVRPDILPTRASMLTLVTAMAVHKAIENITGADVKIKWPNDIVIHNRKVCGILTEMSAEPDYINYIVIGAGVNVNIDVFPEELAHIATSIKREYKKSINRAELIAGIMEEFEKYYRIFLKTEDMSELLQEYNLKMINRGKTVVIIKDGQEQQRTAIGINKEGELLVRDEERGEVSTIISGEVSIRGVYGYS